MSTSGTLTPSEVGYAFYIILQGRGDATSVGSDHGTARPNSNRTVHERLVLGFSKYP